MNLDEAKQTFMVESRELLDDLESGLLRLEQSPGDEELVNALFRAAHTIKGSAGIFGFDRLQSFTHRVEGVLDRLRSGSLQVGEELVANLLAARDFMALLVDAEAEGAALDAEQNTKRSAIEAKLERHLGVVAPVAAPAAPPPTGVPAAGVWHVAIRFEPSVLRSGLDPLALVRYLRKIGTVERVVPDLSAMPEGDDFHAEECYLGLTLAISGALSRTDLDDAFEFFREDADIRLLPPQETAAGYIDAIEALPEDAAARLGTILVQSGAITARQLEDALRRQHEAGQQGTPPRIGELLTGQGVVAGAVVEAAVAKQQHSQDKAALAARSLRIDANKLDTLINLVGELVIAGAATNLIAQQLSNETLFEANSVVRRLVEEIRDTALRLRMVPIGDTFNRFHRVVRDVSKDLNKEIELVIEGGETELDKTVVEKIADPLMHLVRNAMDHGIEDPAGRSTAGKAPQGTVRLNAYHDSGSIVIEVADDGRGIDEERLLAKAVEKGLVTAGQPLTRSEILRLIFEPGLSTAAAVSNLSGRGVGMDVVRRNIESLRGAVDIDSVAGRGTTVRIRLPLTLAIIDGFLVRVGESAYVIPLDMVRECIEMDAAGAAHTADHYINLRGEVLPYLRLGEVFNETASGVRRENIVVVQHGGQKAGLVVDNLLGEVQTVIKPLGKVFGQLAGVSGATILGSGDVAVILDIPQLIQLAATGGAAARRWSRGAAAA